MAAIFRELSTGLSEKQRMVFLLREVEGLSCPEVAEILNCRESTVRNHLFNARKYLRGELLRRYPEYAGGWGLEEAARRTAVSCPDWSALAALRNADRRDDAEPAGWAAAVAHLDACPRCRREALAADPLLVFRRLPALELDAGRGALRGRVDAPGGGRHAHRPRRLESRRRFAGWRRWAAAAALALVASLVGGPRPGPAVVAAPAPACPGARRRCRRPRLRRARQGTARDARRTGPSRRPRLPDERQGHRGVHDRRQEASMSDRCPDAVGIPDAFAVSRGRPRRSVRTFP